MKNKVFSNTGVFLIGVLSALLSCVLIFFILISFLKKEEKKAINAINLSTNKIMLKILNEEKYDHLEVFMKSSNDGSRVLVNELFLF